VFKTSCLKDISDVEFSFVCAEASGEQVEHIFERGALTKSDHWDTSVQCKKCLEPTMHHVLMKKAHDDEKDAEEDEASDSEKDTEKESEKESEKDEEKVEATEEAKEEAKENATADEEAKKAEEAKAVEDLKETATKMVAVPPSYAAFYGPGGCVTTYKGPSGSCIMETNCEGESMADFTYGLMCVDGKGERVRHVFMGDAFDSVETFDTLIECDLCLGLDSAGSVGLGQEVGTLKDEVKVLTEKVAALEGHGAAAATAAATDANETSNTTANASMLIHTGLRLSKRAANDEDSTPAPAAPAEVEVDVIHHNHETKFLKSSKGVKMSSHSDWDPISMRLKQPNNKRAQRPSRNLLK
jgi:chemotaxis protein histidine kinase CheA